jgi:hypothetical protein
MIEPARVDLSVVPVVRNGAMVGAAANGHVVLIPPRMDDHAPWMLWSHDGMGGMVSTYRGSMVTVTTSRAGFRVAIDTQSDHATRADVYDMPSLPHVAGLLREVFR